MPDREAVISVIEQWADAIHCGHTGEAGNLFAASVEICGEWVSRDDAVADIERRAASASISPYYTLGEAEVSVHASHAHVAPVFEVTFHHSTDLSFHLVRENGGWLIDCIVEGARHPIERGLPELGPAYVERIERWAAESLAWIRSTLYANPPQGGQKVVRRHAVSALDEVLHLRSAPFLAPVGDFLRSQVDRALDGIVNRPVESGARIWKIYDHGWVVKTRNHCWAHDISVGYRDAAMRPDQIETLVGAVDVFFVSHWHRDHADPDVIRCALANGVPVTAAPPFEGFTVPNDIASHPDMCLLDPARWSMPGQTGDTGGVGWRALPGHQDHRFNAMFLTTADGITVLQTGDQYNLEDREWIERIGETEQVDVLLTWLPQLKEMTESVRPRVVLPGHENELGHLFEHREPYDQSYEKLRDLPDYESHVLSWGEFVRVVARS